MLKNAVFAAHTITGAAYCLCWRMTVISFCVSPECWNHLRPFPKQVRLQSSYHVLRAMWWWSGMIHAAGSPLWAWPISSLPTRMFSPCRPRCFTSTNISNNLTRNYARTPEIQQLLEPPPSIPPSLHPSGFRFPLFFFFFSLPTAKLVNIKYLLFYFVFCFFCYYCYYIVVPVIFFSPLVDRRSSVPVIILSRSL